VANQRVAMPGVVGGRGRSSAFAISTSASGSRSAGAPSLGRFEGIADDRPEVVVAPDAHESHQDGIWQLPLRRFLLDPPAALF